MTDISTVAILISLFLFFFLMILMNSPSSLLKWFFFPESDQQTEEMSHQKIPESLQMSARAQKDLPIERVTRCCTPINNIFFLHFVFSDLFRNASNLQKLCLRISNFQRWMFWGQFCFSLIDSLGDVGLSVG